MSTMFQWFLTVLGSLFSLIPHGDASEPIEEPAVFLQQEYGDAPEVQGIATSTLPETSYTREIYRSATWTPPETEELTAESIMIMDKESGKILWSRNPEKIWPTASITKLMSAIVFMKEFGEDEDIWDKPYIMQTDDEIDGTVYIYRGERTTVYDLFHLSLIGSINSATRALMHSMGLTVEEAVELMNKQARSFGLWNTHFSDVTGLSAENVTTAKEAAWLLKEALGFDRIHETLLKPSYEFTLANGRAVRVFNTNKLLDSDLHIEGGKTGFISESKYNFTVSVTNDDGHSVIVVVMGTAEPQLRFTESAALAEWAFDSYIWN